MKYQAGLLVGPEAAMRGRATARIRKAMTVNEDLETESLLGWARGQVAIRESSGEGELFALCLVRLADDIRYLMKSHYTTDEIR